MRAPYVNGVKKMEKFMVLCTFKQGTVMSEVFAGDAADARSTVETLPMSKWWDIDVFPLAAPVVPGGAA